MSGTGQGARLYNGPHSCEGCALGPIFTRNETFIGVKCTTNETVLSLQRWATIHAGQNPTGSYINDALGSNFKLLIGVAVSAATRLKLSCSVEATSTSVKRAFIEANVAASFEIQVASPKTPASTSRLSPGGLDITSPPLIMLPPP